MGFFDRFKKKEDEPTEPEAPASIKTASKEGVLCAPVSGKVIPMTEVPDPVFSGEVLGKGCAVWPENDDVYAPASGQVTITMGHAVSMTSDDGVEILVHIGVDTVNLQGKGFTGYVVQDDRVVAGQPVITMDRQVIADAGYKDCVVIAVSNTSDYSSVEMLVEPGSTVSAGDAILKVTK